jgi:hypothetical protein
LDAVSSPGSCGWWANPLTLCQSGTPSLLS